MQGFTNLHLFEQRMNPAFEIMWSINYISDE
jgi:hypothetical protein